MFSRSFPNFFFSTGTRIQRPGRTVLPKGLESFSTCIYAHYTLSSSNQSIGIYKEILSNYILFCMRLNICLIGTMQRLSSTPYWLSERSCSNTFQRPLAGYPRQIPYAFRMNLRIDCKMDWGLIFRTLLAILRLMM